jgi:hypothetical protein
MAPGTVRAHNSAAAPNSTGVVHILVAVGTIVMLEK